MVDLKKMFYRKMFMKKSVLPVMMLVIACLLCSCNVSDNTEEKPEVNPIENPTENSLENDGGYHPATDEQGVFVGQDKEVIGYYERTAIARDCETLEEMQSLLDEAKRGHLVVKEDGTAYFELDGEKTEYFYDDHNFYLSSDTERANGFSYTYINGRLIISDETSVTQYMRLTDDEIAAYLESEGY